MLSFNDPSHSIPLPHPWHCDARHVRAETGRCDRFSAFLYRGIDDDRGGLNELENYRIDVSAIAFTIVAAAGVVASLKFDPTIGTVMTAIGVIATAVFGYLKARRAEAATRKNAIDVAHISAGATIDTNAKTSLVQTVTAERAKWRSELREIVTELTALLRASTRNGTVDWMKVDQLQSGVRLRLNPAGRGPAPPGVDEHPKDRLIHADLDALDQAGWTGTGEHAGVADQLERHMAELLKQEWDVSKDEAVKGKLKTG